MGLQATRARDEEVLDWIAMRLNGWSLGDVAAEFGTKPALVAQATNNVKKHDIAKSGEPRGAVAGAYW